MPETPKYTAKDIQVLSMVDHVRKRPRMYIGSLDGIGIFNLFKSLVDNSLDEVAAGHCTEIIIDLNDDGHIVVSDNGRGIPVTQHPHLNKPLVEVLFTELGTGPKSSFSPVVCALSKHLEVETSCQDEIGWINTHSIEFSRGRAITDLEDCEYVSDTGTMVAFQADPQIFGDQTIDRLMVEDLVAAIKEQYPDILIELNG